MIAAVKYARAERELKPARPYGQGTQEFYTSIEAEKLEKKPDHLMVLMSSDRGLCGGVHSNITRMLKVDIHGRESDPNFRIICVGDKIKAQINRFFAKNFLLTCNDIGKRPPTFSDAARLAQGILDSGYNYQQGDIYVNRFKSVVSYKTTKLPILNVSTVSGLDAVSIYDSLDGEVLQSYMEYSLSSLLYYALKEGATSEQSSRMTAMDAASKNAGEIIEKMTLLFNRTRQAVITKELIEIISGAAAI